MQDAEGAREEGQELEEMAKGEVAVKEVRGWGWLPVLVRVMVWGGEVVRTSVLGKARVVVESWRVASAPWPERDARGRGVAAFAEGNEKEAAAVAMAGGVY